MSQVWVVDSACSVNLTAFRREFTTFASSSDSSRVGGVGVDVMGRGIFYLATPLCSAQVYVALCMPFRPGSALRIGRLFSVSWMQSHIGREFIFPTAFSVGLLVVPT
jgi:hypothetical protein